ncbi:hypothetical protein GNE08_07605 [Trichormus variabilis ARAD]|uniref:Uncharacterized protein n=1 Tax=Trichormus variabilis N2B TaxID=2681315 RepID=A0ABR6SAA8_ANAVA|nr:hypothetical protein [Trichormus variabilis]MBC1214085.1 hypothetical protein [Trichormus variabilis ARAD]MBC1257307.1 hypothetical protein [Trichormus variabilis V5]MBC1303346.1 hypothetical protein [Trichormus variabilis N2B]MBD2380929.1 hypothetical protein [Trichormus variabilis FACHB-319]
MSVDDSQDLSDRLRRGEAHPQLQIQNQIQQWEKILSKISRNDGNQEG